LNFAHFSFAFVFVNKPQRRKFNFTFNSETMNNTSFGAVKLRVHLQNLVKTPTKENAAQLLQNMQDMKSENFQFIQDSFIANLLMLVDGADGL